jgi:hypothetical protein
MKNKKYFFLNINYSYHFKIKKEIKINIFNDFNFYEIFQT